MRECEDVPCGECAIVFPLKEYIENISFEKLLSILISIKNPTYIEQGRWIGIARRPDGTSMNIMFTCDGELYIALPINHKECNYSPSAYLACEITDAVQWWRLSHVQVVCDGKFPMYEELMKVLTTNVDLNPAIALAETMLLNIQKN